MDAVMIKLLIDLFGVVAEVFVLRYLLRGFLGKPQLNIWQEALLYGSLGIAFLLISTFGLKGYIRTFGYGMAVVAVLLFYPGKKQHKILLGLFYLVFLVLIESAVHSFFVLVYGEVFDTGIDQLGNYVVGCTVSKFLSILLMRIAVAFKEDVMDERTQLPKFWFLLFLIMPTVSILVLYLLLVMALKLNEVQYFGLYLLAIVLILTANLAVFHLFGKLLISESYKERVIIVEQQLQQQTAYYTAMTEKNRYIQGLFHDMKNILLSLTGYLRQNDVAQALEKIGQYGVTLQSSQQDWTNDLVLDTVIETKAELAQKKACKLHVTAALPVPLGCDSMALGVVLANGLDNAIEAVQQIKQPDQRWIRLKLGVQNGFVVVKLQNPTEQPMKISNQKIPTSKVNQELHGLGLENMRRLALEHGGDLFLQAEDALFTLTVQKKEGAAMSCGV